LKEFADPHKANPTSTPAASGNVKASVSFLFILRRKEDRQKEKESAWMDTYIQNESAFGILGGQAPNGELDGIKAWKKGLKERDTRDKEASTTTGGLSKTAAEPTSTSSDFSDKPLDEIQIFRLLMKKKKVRNVSKKMQLPLQASQ
jgi:hypothetical protein